jgi:hypothetical protein
MTRYSPPKVKPLNATGSQQNPMPEAVLNQKTKNSSLQANTISHSARTESGSVKYHAKHFGGRQSAARVTDQLNPDRSVSMANKTGRSFPGL